MSDSDPIRRLKGEIPNPCVRAPAVEEAIRAANEARNAARTAADLVEPFDAKSARELRLAADAIAATAKRMWSV